MLGTNIRNIPYFGKLTNSFVTRARMLNIRRTVAALSSSGTSPPWRSRAYPIALSRARTRALPNGPIPHTMRTGSSVGGVHGDEEHVALLKQGGDVWNAWRHKNPHVSPDRFGAILRGANLC